MPASLSLEVISQLSNLKRLRDAKTLDDVAKLLGFTPSGLAYVLFKMPNALKYQTFDIPKRGGGKRVIKAPTPRLKLAQTRLAKYLYECLSELQKATPPRRSLAHGFERHRSIMTNAALHKRRRYVLNLDLEDFFPSINFGRVRGFFIKDNHFQLQEKVANVLAQIACHDHSLPQGSPCSPIISNLVGHLLDARLARFAKKHKCTYSRYADDITFSTSKKDFPPELASPVAGSTSDWKLGAELRDKIEHSGFKINDSKTRMQWRGSRQVTTGLMVNAKVNIRQEYYRMARSMCRELFSTGSYYRRIPAPLLGGAVGDDDIKNVLNNLNTLEGILNHINQVKDFSDQRTPYDKKESPTAPRTLYRNFLFYKHFVALTLPLILPEGKTDTVYLECAIRRLSAFQPRLGSFNAGKFESAIRFMNYSQTVHNIMQLGGGTGDMKHLILHYPKIMKKFDRVPCDHPVILLIDNDKGAVKIFSLIKEMGGPNISLNSSDKFYHLGLNLYLVKTPELGSGKHSCIEDLFDPMLLKTVVDGKTFDPSKNAGTKGKYGKTVFADKVVWPNVTTIDFSKFSMLLDRIVAAMDHHTAGKAAPLAVAI